MIRLYPKIHMDFLDADGLKEALRDHETTV